MPILPFFAFILAFLLLPTLAIFRGALLDDHNQLTAQYMLKLLSAPYISPYISTIEISIITAVAGGLLGFFMAWAITLGGLPGSVRNATLSFCGVASNFAGLPLAFALAATLGRNSLLVDALSSIGINLYPDFSIYSVIGVCLAYTFFQIPFMVLIMTPALDGLRVEWREAAFNLGANQSQYWRFVTLPILAPSLLSAFALLFANSFGAFATAAILIGAGPGSLIIVSIAVSREFSSDITTNPHQGYALAVGMVIIVLVTIILYSITRARAERWRPRGT
ncbi:MAG TPA: ABC transporter permease subunit [Aggregatilineales bacterium]|nr:ABC transporter permease subunit [Aggregatilineales bacterium]